MADNIQVQDAMYSYFVMGFQMHLFEEDYIQTGVNLGWINEGQANALRMQFFPDSLKDKGVVSADTPTAKNSESAVPPSSSSESQSQPSSNVQSESSSKPASDKPTSASKPSSDSKPASASQSASSSNSDKPSESASSSESNSQK